MRTKALLLTAAVGAISVASTLAQVYSVNVVGFVNVSMATPGWYLLSNPLKGTNDTLETIMPTVPDNTTVFTWNTVGQTWNSPAQYSGGFWDPERVVIQPGSAFFIQVPQATTLTFVGEVRQGTLATPLVVGWNFVGSQVAQGGLLGDTSAATQDLGYVPGENDIVFQFNGASHQYGSPSQFGGGFWDPEPGPTLTIAEGVALNRAAAGTWSRTFQVQ